MADTAVRTEELRRYFDNTRAVDGVDLDVKTGEIYGFLGPNGAGKSTLVHVLCTLLLPTSGRAEVAGFDVARQPVDVRLRIGVALQEASLDPAQSGIELLRLQGRLYGLSKHEIDERLRDLTQLVDIGPALGHRISTYSGGMRRRLDLAAALVHNPQVLFLDEPTTGLDPASRVRVWDEVRRLNAEGITIFLTTQYLEEADALARLGRDHRPGRRRCRASVQRRPGGRGRRPGRHPRRGAHDPSSRRLRGPQPGGDRARRVRGAGARPHTPRAV